MSNDNPFERYDLDPLEGIGGITQRMRDRIADAKSEEERSAIRADWVALTKDPRKRLALCLGAHPESRPPLAAKPMQSLAEDTPLDSRELLPFVSYLACFGESEEPIDTAASWLEDPLFKGRASVTSNDEKE